MSELLSCCCVVAFDKKECVYYRNMDYKNEWGMDLGKKYKSVLFESMKESVRIIDIE